MKEGDSWFSKRQSGGYCIEEERNPTPTISRGFSLPFSQNHHVSSFFVIFASIFFYVQLNSTFQDSYELYFKLESSLVIIGFNICIFVSCLLLSNSLAINWNDLLFLLNLKRGNGNETNNAFGNTCCSRKEWNASITVHIFVVW